MHGLLISFIHEPIISSLKFKMANGRRIENRSWSYFCFATEFGLRRAAAFVSSPIHLFISVSDLVYGYLSLSVF